MLCYKVTNFINSLNCGKKLYALFIDIDDNNAFHCVKQIEKHDFYY